MITQKNKKIMKQTSIMWIVIVIIITTLTSYQSEIDPDISITSNVISIMAVLLFSFFLHLNGNESKPITIVCTMFLIIALAWIWFNMAIIIASILTILPLLILILPWMKKAMCSCEFDKKL